MAGTTPNPNKRGYGLPAGCKDLIDVLKSTGVAKSPQSGKSRVSGQIRARKMRVIGKQGEQLGTMSLGEALNLARKTGTDLVQLTHQEVPICRLTDFGKER